MLSKQLEQLAALEKVATGPRWVSSDRGDGSGSVYGLDDAGGTALIDDARCPYIRGEVRCEDAELAVALRNAAPEWIALAMAGEEMAHPRGPHPLCDGHSGAFSPRCTCLERRMAVFESKLAVLSAALPVAGETEAE